KVVSIEQKNLVPQCDLVCKAAVMVLLPCQQVVTTVRNPFRQVHEPLVPLFKNCLHTLANEFFLPQRPHQCAKVSGGRCAPQSLPRTQARLSAVKLILQLSSRVIILTPVRDGLECLIRVLVKGCL